MRLLSQSLNLLSRRANAPLAAPVSPNLPARPRAKSARRASTQGRIRQVVSRAQRDKPTQILARPHLATNVSRANTLPVRRHSATTALQGRQIKTAIRQRASNHNSMPGHAAHAVVGVVSRPCQDCAEGKYAPSQVTQCSDCPSGYHDQEDRT